MGKSLIVMGYAVAVYLVFLAVLAYGVGFFADAGVPRTVDDGPHPHVAVAVAVDLALLAVFAAQHSVMARPWFKAWWTRIVPVAAERSTYVLAASLVQALLFWQWRPIDAPVWRVPDPFAALVWAGYVLGWSLAVVSTYLIDHGDLFGVRQAWCRWRGHDYRPPAFRETGLYRHVRHPLMTGFVIVFWCTPRMSAGHLLLAVASTGYILVGIAFEERDLLRSLGAVYAEYRTRVPALVPYRLRRSA